MKKFLSVLLALSLVMSLGVMAMAATVTFDVTTDVDGTTTDIELSFDDEVYTTGATIVEGGGAIPADPTKSGFVFKGWYTDATGGTKLNLTTHKFTAATTIYAQWTANTVSSFTIANETSTAIPVHSVGPAFYKFSSDNGYMTDKANPSVAYGNTIFYPVFSAAGELITKSDAVKGINPKADWEMGKDYVESVEIVKKKVVTAYSGTTPTAYGYGYFVAVKLKASTKTAGTDVIGEITLKKSTGDWQMAPNASGKKERSFAVDVTVKYSDVVVEAAKNLDIVYDSAYLYDFGDGEEEFEFTFDAISDAFFIVNTKGQGDLVLKVTSDFNDDIAALYPEANLDFFNGNGAKFNRTGELYLPADEDSYLYAVQADGTLAAVKAEYDEYEEAWVIKTRTLGVYVISDVELDLTAVVTPVDPDEPAEPSNPSTGAAA